jgi:hypothetical protein
MNPKVCVIVQNPPLPQEQKLLLFTVHY